MPEIKGHNLHIFLTSKDRYREWYAEQVFGSIAKEILDKYGDAIEWMWLGRYDDRKFSDFPELPAVYNFDGTTRCVDIRLGIKEGFKEGIENYAKELAIGTEFYPLMRNYDLYVDVTHPEGNAKNRFIRPDANEDERLKRAHLVKDFMNATSRLYLDAIVPNNNEWRVEPNFDNENPQGNFLRSVIHLFHNTTQVPIVFSLPMMYDAEGRSIFLVIPL